MAIISGLMVLAMTGLIVAGSICGIVALFKIRDLRRVLEQTRGDLYRAIAQLRAFSAGDFPVQEKVAPPLPVAAPLPDADIVPPLLVSDTPPASEPRFDAVTVPAPEPPVSASPLSLEMRMGTRWIIWVGAVIFLGGVAWALKYTYDNNLIGPSGRILLGVLTGIAALFAGEYYYRRRMTIPFQAFTGAGLAILYLCVFFSFQVYHLSGAGLSMLLAVGITALAIFLSVVHNALPIALLAVAGGYMSPILLSTGQNAPWTLFTYVAILNLVALGAAFFRRWRALDLFCLAGTALLYIAWHSTYFTYPSGLMPALTFITLFYAMFMAAPMVYGLSRRVPEGLDSLTLIIGNSLFWLYCYYETLYTPHRSGLGYVVLSQALFVLLLYRVWTTRLPKEKQVAVSLLGISLSLFTLVIPLLLRFDLTPVAWAVQGTLLLWLSFRFNNTLCRLAGVGVLALSIFALLIQLPLHMEAFTPVFNKDFGVWAFVIAAVSAAAFITLRQPTVLPYRQVLAGGLLLTALALTCWLLTAETFLYWTFLGGSQVDINRTAALVLLWTAIPALLVAAAAILRKMEVGATAQAAWTVGLMVLLFSFMVPRYRDDWLFLNLYAAPKLAFILALWWGVAWLKQLPQNTATALSTAGRYRPDSINRFLELAGHASLALLAFAETVRWGMASSLISKDMAIGIVSALWALHACILTWHGLVSRQAYRRYAGILLFALAVIKTVLLDAFNLAGVYRIISWLGVGILLVIVALLYQRYSALLPAEDSESANNADSRHDIA